MRLWEATSQRVRPGNTEDIDYLQQVLADHWEPFAVTWDGDVFDYHLRRSYNPDDRLSGPAPSDGEPS